MQTEHLPTAVVQSKPLWFYILQPLLEVSSSAVRTT